MKIAICAWGSLIWDPRDLLIQHPFVPSGPALPIEFSRVSGGSGHPQRLTLVIDPHDGVACDTYVAESTCTYLPDAIENLRLREGMRSGRDVGVLDRQSGVISPIATVRHPKAALALRDWLVDTDYEAVIWTALPPNFAARSASGADFSTEEAVRFLENLPPQDLAIALTYIRNAPREVQTPFRSAARQSWPSFLAEAA